MKGHNTVRVTSFTFVALLAASLLLGAAALLPVFYETRVVAGHGRVDSIAMWVAPNPEQSILYITDKTKNCLEKHDPVSNIFLGRLGSSGSAPGQLRYPNGIDIAYNVPTGRGVRDLLIVTDRDNNRLAIWSLPDETYMGSVSDPAMIEPYGVATFWEGDQLQVFATDNGGPTDDVFIFNILPDSQGVRGVLQRTIATQTILESLTVDQFHRRLLLCDEKRSEVMVYDLQGNLLQRFGLGHFVREPEGIQIYDTGEGTGYIIVSDQIANPTEYEVFDRQTFAWLGNFSGSTRDTDGIEIVQTALSNLPNGSFFAQHTDRNAHCYDWGAIANALGLRTEYVDYRYRPDAKLTLQMPTGGEALQVDSVYTITWTAENTYLANPVTIEYSADNGQSWQVLVAQTENDGQFQWHVATAPTSTARMRIADATDGQPSDESDSTFKIIGPPTQIKIISGDCQRSQPNTTLPAPLEVKVTDINGNAVSNALVTFAVIEGEGTLSPASSVKTSLNGRARVWLTLGSQTGTSLVQAQVAGLDSNVTFTAWADSQAFASNLAYGKQASASSTSGSNSPARAVDGSECSFWSSGPLNSQSVTQWLMVNLQSPQLIEGIMVKWDGNFYAREYQIQLSNDQLTWKTVYTENAGVGGTLRVQLPPTSAQFVRLYMTAKRKDRYRINELEVLGAGDNNLSKTQSERTAESGQLKGTTAAPLLLQIYPNPFNPATLISFTLPQEQAVLLQIYNLNGQVVSTLVNRRLPAGAHQVTFEATALPAGVYFALLKTGTVTQVRRLLYLK